MDEANGREILCVDETVSYTWGATWHGTKKGGGGRITDVVPGRESVDLVDWLHSPHCVSIPFVFNHKLVAFVACP